MKHRQTQTTHCHYTAHRLDSVRYDDALTVIYHYNNYGQIDSLYDESGVMCYQYGNMGEVTKETRIYALPFLSQPIALSTQFSYDSWGRIQNITYPDGEVVHYAYDLGGQLERMYNSSYTYLDDVAYDRFGAKVSQEYGNGIATSYSYNNTTRRLSGITTLNGNSPLSSFAYTYDPVGNVTQVTSTCPWLPNHTFTESFTYDASDQLTAASETGSNSYRLSVLYDNWGKVNTYDLTQTDLLLNPITQPATTQNTYVFNYPDPNNPQDCQTGFAPELRNFMSGSYMLSSETLTYGINGSLRRRDNPQQSVTEYYLHNSAGNLKAYSSSGWNFAYYGYDAANTRTYKLSMYNASQWVNGQPQSLQLQLQSAMFYPNAYLTFNANGEYTKHYYNGSERICSRLGDRTFSLDCSASLTPQTQQRLGIRIMNVDQRARAELLELVEAGDIPIETPSVDITSLQPANPNANSHSHSNTSNDIFYYHTNHLGSTAFVTDNNATVTQGFLYAPFGEIISEYQGIVPSSALPKYAFNAKELDEETGMYYYEARYYNPPVFVSRDPHFERYFWTSPYGYCSNNPMKYVDQTGEDFDPVVDDDANTITIKATYCTTKTDKDRLEKALDVWNNQSGKYTYTMGEGDNAKNYTVLFDLTMKVFDNDDALVDGAEQGQNFFNGRGAPCSDCWAISDGANILALPIASKRSIAHEVGHTLGIADDASNEGLMLTGGSNSYVTGHDVATILKVAGLHCNNYNELHTNGAKAWHTYSFTGELRRVEK